jgi:4-hydroxy-tetrahydrodipicolinate synthase
LAVKPSEAKQWAQERLRGVIDSPVLHLQQDDRLDEESYRHWIQYDLLDLKREGVYSTAETLGYAACTVAEIKRLTEITIDEAKRAKPSALKLVGTGRTSVRECVELTQHAAELGADAAVIVPPSFECAGDPAVVRYFEYVAERCDLPLIIYNTPAAGYALDPGVIARLAQVRTVVGLKQGAYWLLNSELVMELTKGGFVVGEMADPYALMGAFKSGRFASPVMFGFVSYLIQSTTDLVFNRWAEALFRGELELAHRVFFETPLHDAYSTLLRSFYNPLRPQYPVHPVALWKFWGNRMGVPMGAELVRPPHLDATEEQKGMVTAFLQRAGWEKR